MAQGFSDVEKTRIRHHLGCTACGESKATNEFHVSSALKSGFRQPCKACQRAGRAAYQRKWKRANIEKDKAMTAAWHEKNPTYERERARRLWKNDPVYRARIKVFARAWAKETPEYYRAASKLRRARLRGVECAFTIMEARELFDEYRGLCVYCLSRATTLDHVVPVSKGGAHTKANLVPSCKSCNSSKHDRPLIVWLSERKAA